MFQRVLSSVLVLQLAATAAGHAAITTPAARGDNDWCPWCHGDQDFVHSHSEQVPQPHFPCWDASLRGRVKPEKFNDMAKLTDPDGEFWVDQLDAPEDPIWCPGQTVNIRMYLHADHNGVYRWESQLAKPGEEVNGSFQSFTSWRSINHDPNTDYYSTDGVKAVALDDCPNSGGSWANSVANCKTGTFAKTNMTLPDSLPAGPTVIRWLWYGARDLDLHPVTGPESSLFVQCIDVVVGSPEQCDAAKRRLMLV